MSAREIQRKDLAGKTKLTAVRIGHGFRVVQFFAWCHHDKDGNAILAESELNKHLDLLNVKRGQTWWNG